MNPPARPWTKPAPAYDPFDDVDTDVGTDYAFGTLSPGDPIGPPVTATRGRTLRNSVLILTVLGGGYWLLGDSSILPQWPGSGPPAASTPERPAGVPGPAPARNAADTQSPPAQTPVQIVDVPPAAPVAAAALPPAASGYDDPPARLPKTEGDDAVEPYRKRAAAAGLHPDLSRVLLAKLSPADYRNAAAAIETALAKTPDGAVYSWPLDPKPEQAVFEVHFVPGAAADCRRYVVTIAKDRWVTTALPMEKCGLKSREVRRE